MCDRDCFHCKSPDCIAEGMTAEDYRDAKRIEVELLNPKSYKEKQLASKQRAYYEANREEIAVKQRAYREAKKEKKRGERL